MELADDDAADQLEGSLSRNFDTWSIDALHSFINYPTSGRDAVACLQWACSRIAGVHATSNLNSLLVTFEGLGDSIEFMERSLAIIGRLPDSLGSSGIPRSFSEYSHELGPRRKSARASSSN